MLESIPLIEAHQLVDFAFRFCPPDQTAPIANRLDFQLVRRKENGFTLILQPLILPLSGLLIKATGRLIQYQQIRSLTRLGQTRLCCMP